MREERSIDSAIRKALWRQMPGPASSCPDENVLAAYLEGGLSDQERSRLEDHVSGCSSCQELLALSMKTAEDEPLPAAEIGTSRERKSLFRFSVPLAAIAVLVLGIGTAALFLLTRGFRKPERTEVAQQMPPAVSPRVSGEMSKVRPESSTVPVEPVRPSAPSPPPAQAARMRGAADQMTPAKGNVRTEEQPLSAEYLHLPGPEGKLSTADRIASNEAAGKPGVWKGESQPGAAAAKAGGEAGSTGITGGVVGGGVGGILPPPRPAEKPPVREAAPQAVAVTLDSGAARTGAPDRTANLAPKSQRASLSLAPAAAAESRLRDIIRRVASDEKAGRRPDSATRMVSGRIFELSGGFWVDLRCIGNPDAELIECKQGSPGFHEVLKNVPGLDELRRDGLPILLDWNGKICLIR